MKIKIRNLKRIIKENMGVDSHNLEVGDLVDVDLEEAGFIPQVRVLELTSDVRSSAGLVSRDEDPTHDIGSDFDGPGFLGYVEGDNYENVQGEEMWFSLKQIVPGSRLNYYFPS